MKIIMTIQYGLGILIFVPLYILVMYLLMHNFPALFYRVRCKASVFSAIFIIVLIFRYVYYCFL